MNQRAMCGLCEGICFRVMQKSQSNTKLWREKDVLTSVDTLSNPEIYSPTSEGGSPHLGFVLGGRKQAIKHSWGSYWIWGGDDMGLLPQSLSF